MFNQLYEVHITLLVINSLGGRHTHTQTHTQMCIPTIRTGSILRNQAGLKIVQKLTEFLLQHLMPEIMTRKNADYSEEKPLVDSDCYKENSYCVCRSQSSGRMTACDNHLCNYHWFYY